MLAGLAATLGDCLLTAHATAVAPPSRARHTQTMCLRSDCAAWQSLGQPADWQTEAKPNEFRAQLGARRVGALMYVSRDREARASSERRCAARIPRIEQRKLPLHHIGSDAIRSNVICPQPPTSEPPKGNECGFTYIRVFVGTCL